MRQIQVWFQNRRQRSLGGRPFIVEHTGITVEAMKTTPEVLGALLAMPVISAGEVTAALLAQPIPPATAPEAAEAAEAPDTPSSPSSPFAQMAPISPMGPQVKTTPTGMPTGGFHRVGTVDSLADLAEVAECVGNIETLTGGLQRVGSLQDLTSQAFLSISRASSYNNLASLSRVGSIADFASFLAPPETAATLA